jgi:monoamine oxidase
MEASGVESHEVVIVGGGAAGLVAASALAAEGVDVVLLDARSRWGGRIQTLRNGPEPIELGAEFVHGDAPYTSALAREAGIELAAVEMTQRWGRGDALVEIPDCDRAQAAAVQAAVDAVRGKADRPFAEALAASHAADPGRRLVLQYVEGFQAADATRISTRALAQGDLGGEQTRRVPGGYDLLVEALVKRIPPGAARLEHEVRSIRWSADPDSVVRPLPWFGFSRPVDRRAQRFAHHRRLGGRTRSDRSRSASGAPAGRARAGGLRDGDRRGPSVAAGGAR